MLILASRNEYNKYNWVYQFQYSFLFYFIIYLFWNSFSIAKCLIFFPGSTHSKHFYRSILRSKYTHTYITKIHVLETAMNSNTTGPHWIWSAQYPNILSVWAASSLARPAATTRYPFSHSLDLPLGYTAISRRYLSEACSKEPFTHRWPIGLKVFAIGWMWLETYSEFWDHI